MTRHYTDLGTASDWSCRGRNLPQPIRSTTLVWVLNDASSVWNFCARLLDVISQGNQWWRREMFSQSRYICYEPISLYLSIWLNHFKWTDCAVEDTPKAANIYSQNLKQDFWDLTTTGRRFPKLSQSQRRISELTYVYSTPIWRSARKGFPTYLRGSKGLCSQGKNRVSLNEN